MEQQQSNFYTLIIISLVLVGSLLLSPLTTIAATSVTNNISVSANSSGSKSHNEASVKTVINGQVVEDWSTTSTKGITYQSNFRTQDDSLVSTKTISNTTKITPDEQRIQQQLFALLQILTQLYVTLYSQQ